jgi:hypothetical protein
LRAATTRVIEEPRYRAAAGRMASRLAAERNDNLVVDELEHIAAAAAHTAVGGPGPAFPADPVRLIAQRPVNPAPGENPDTLN